jgi:nonsense-mediated mRNA decay protein 3
MAVLVCPVCGRTSDRIAFIEAFCIEDYPVNVKVPDRMEMERCKRCGSMHLRGEWMQFNEGKIARLVASRCRGDFKEATYDVGRQTAVMTIIKDGKEIKVERRVPLEMTETICPRCSRISGGYYEGIIQLRGKDREKMERYAAMLVKRLEKKTFITKTEEKDEGLDLYVGNSKAVVELMGALGVRTIISKKLVGRDQGKRLYRTTFLIRL